MKVMVVDDELSIRLLVKTVLGQAGHECVCVEDGAAALELFESERPDLVVLDVMMPYLDGFEVCRRIRLVDEAIPVLFLSAKGDIVDKRIGFSNGGDDYLVKPFDEEELLMRAEALLRRSKRACTQGVDTSERFALGEFSFDALRHQVFKNGEIVSLTPKEFRLLFHLASHHGQVMSKDELVESIWGSEYLDDAINIAVYVRKLRERIEDNPAKPERLKTVWGVGYVFEA